MKIIQILSGDKSELYGLDESGLLYKFNHSARNWEQYAQSGEPIPPEAPVIPAEPVEPTPEPVIEFPDSVVETPATQENTDVQA
jgi:hypothetical protein